MSKLIDNILQFSSYRANSDKLPIEEIDISKTLEESLSLIETSIQSKNIKIEVNKSNNLIPNINANKISILRMFNNLLSNAIKFSDRDSTIFISFASDNNHLRVEIKDEGTGISNDKIAQLFLPFKHSGVGTDGEKGTGLGLSIVKEIVEGNNGKIGIESELGKGTSVKISFDKGAA